MLGLTIFTISSFACAISPNLWVLVGFRCVQAIGAAMLIPSSLGLVLTTIPPARVKRGVRLWAVSGAAAGAIGPVVGGLLTSLSWRWIFLINLPIGIAAIVVTWKMIPHVRHDFSTKMPDLIGSADGDPHDRRHLVRSAQRSHVGLGQRAHHRQLGRRRRRRGRIRDQHAPRGRAGDRAAAVQKPRVHRGERLGRDRRDDLRDAATRAEPVPAAGVALVNDRHRAGDRTRTGGDS